MKVFKELEIDKKLNKQIEFNKDRNRIENILEFEKILINEVQNIINENINSFQVIQHYESKENTELFKLVYESFSRFQLAFLKLSEIVRQLQTEKSNLENIQKTFTEKYEELKRRVF